MTGEAPAVERRGEDIVRANMPLVGHLVREILARVPAHVNRDDLLSAGYAALVAAARGFDPERGVPFPRFAATRVRGALLDELRGLDWASRSVRQRARRTDSAREELIAELGRTPTVQEVAERLGCTVEDIEHSEDDVHRATVFSLQGFATATADDIVTEPGAGPEDLLLRRERFGYLRHAVDALPDRLRVVVQGYFFEERPMAQIAAELGVSESRVSQLRAEALVLLRDGMNAHLDPALAAQNPPKEGCVARRRAAYYDRIASRGTLRTRLALTSPDGLPLAVAA
ncbi:sigma-70 family RNA polymerase sigma factor [Actinoplanes sp. NPDC024001]|uniref:sigma-70 family RNA polymerase sigma factor n=1 Tax=Actinoplanes sp. NPDC024001 TaxID=3154598 RepID=UPI0034062999